MRNFNDEDENFDKEVVSAFYTDMIELEKNRKIGMTKELFIEKFTKLFNKLRSAHIIAKRVENGNIVFLFQNKEKALNAYWVYTTSYRNICNQFVNKD